MTERETQQDIDIAKLQKLIKTCDRFHASYTCMKVINKALIKAARLQAERATRFKDHYDNVRVMNLAIVAERNQNVENKAQAVLNKRAEDLLKA